MSFFSRRHATMQAIVGDALPLAVAGSGARNGLRPHEATALAERLATLGSGLVCDTERDGAGNLWTIVGPCDPEATGFTAFLVYRENSRLVLIEAPMSAAWITLGRYGTVMAVAAALQSAIGQRLRSVALAGPDAAAWPGFDPRAATQR